MTDIFDVWLYEMLPEGMRKLPKVRAISYAFRQAGRRLKDYIDKSMVNIDVDALDIAVVDALAAEIEAPYYDEAEDEATRRQAYKDAILNLKQAGTPAAVERMINTVFRSGRVREWFEDGGDPYTFGMETGMPFAPDSMSRIEKIIRSVKNVRSGISDITSIQESETHLIHRPGYSWDEKQTLTNDIYIDEKDTAYPMGGFFVLAEVSELLEDVAIFREELERDALLPAFVGFGAAFDTMTILTETFEETQMEFTIKGAAAVAQDSMTVLTEG